ncbi:MAG TPA: prepilin-type N-terminal cleavage/methylation domain-containing protein [Candidatus Ozemobacteraceae bacterium]|nr:prepilin-type N-terminal cleavage/methylation domain-containing protein [Candidatus Ozemobacteraceae bacterium]
MKRGFTLIELLVVITILAVLAGAAMPYVQSYVEEARLAKAKTDLEEIARALMVYETREGEYNSNDVSLLTGRYLNKAPIDPWGKSYAVSTYSGFVYSGGPDRSLTDADDNIIFSYQPPLALVQVKWIDKNNSGAVDAQNVADELHLLFSRRLSGAKANELTTTDAATAQNALNACFALSSIGTGDITNVVQYGAADAVRITASKTVILKIKPTATPDIFAVGSDKITIKTDHKTLYDLSSPIANACISSQPVTILPQ